MFKADVKANVTGSVANAIKGTGNALSSTSKKIATAILDVLKSGGVNKQGKLKFSTRKTLEHALKGLTNASERSKIINAVGKAFATGALGLGSGVGEIATSIVAPIAASRTQQAAYAAETAKTATAAAERVQLAAIESGVWNNGLSGTPSTSLTKPEGGKESDSKTTGSFLGG